jgi:hypothetical protein
VEREGDEVLVRDCVAGLDDRWGADLAGAERAGADRAGAETLGAETFGAETFGGGGVYLYFWASETPVTARNVRAIADAFPIVRISLLGSCLRFCAH